MAYLQKQNPNNEKNRQTQVQIGRLNKEDQAAVLAKYLDPNVDTNMVFYELSNKAKASRKFEEDDEELLECLQRSRANYKTKSQVNQAQQDEQKRLQFEKILQE